MEHAVRPSTHEMRPFATARHVLYFRIESELEGRNSMKCSSVMSDHHQQPRAAEQAALVTRNSPFNKHLQVEARMMLTGLQNGSPPFAAD